MARAGQLSDVRRNLGHTNFIRSCELIAYLRNSTTSNKNEATGLKSQFWDIRNLVGFFANTTQTEYEPCVESTNRASRKRTTIHRELC